jgi:hypothetical protein
MIISNTSGWAFISPYHPDVYLILYVSNYFGFYPGHEHYSSSYKNMFGLFSQEIILVGFRSQALSLLWGLISKTQYVNLCCAAFYTSQLCTYTSLEDLFSSYFLFEFLWRPGCPCSKLIPYCTGCASP